MKKAARTALCLLLCLSLLSGLSASAAEKQEELKLLVATDTHFQCEADLGEFPAPETAQFTNGLTEQDAALFYYASSQGQMNFESGAILQKLLDTFAAGEEDYLLLSGDLTGGGRQSHLALAERLRETEQTSGKAIFVINGNHDCAAQADERHIDMPEFCEIYADFGYTEARSRHDGSASYTAELGDGYRLLAIDSCIYGEDDGELNDAVTAWVKDELAQAKRDGKRPVVMMHHSILPHFELQPMIPHYRDRAALLADSGVGAVFTGHLHANDISYTKTKNGGELYDVQTGSLISSPNAYRSVTFDGDSIALESRFITEIDPGLLPSGYTPEQLDGLTNDFAGYARRYFEAGVCKWLNRYLGSPYKVAKMLKLQPGTGLYAAVETLMGRLGAAVQLDLYGEGVSVEHIAALGGKQIAQSDCEKLYQVAARIMYGFYHGNEAETSDARYTELLLDSVKAALAYGACALTSPTGRVSFPALTVPARVSFSPVAAPGLLALAQTLAGGFVDDLSYDQDLDTVLTFGGEKPGDAVPLSLFEKIGKLLREFLFRLFHKQ